MATYREAIENKLNMWFFNLSTEEVETIFGGEEHSSKLIDLWYELPIDSKLTIYDECEK